MPVLRKRFAAGGGAALLVVLALGVFLGMAPNPPGICTRLFELAGGEEQALAEVTREQCESSYEERRGGRGVLGFAALGWCIRFADTLEEAGQC